MQDEAALTIRRLGPDEGPLLREIRLAALEEAPYAFGQRFEDAAAQPDEEWRRTAHGSSRGDRRAYFVAFGDESRPVGMVQARRRPPHDCLVFSMWVAPAARRLGVGRALLDCVDEWARGWGARRVVLWVIGGNDGARHFYARIGFELVDSGPDAESGAAYGAVAMTRPIRPSGAG
jgi:GNAT superfamily N-acetyltransferase